MPGSITSNGTLRSGARSPVTCGYGIKVTFGLDCKSNPSVVNYCTQQEDAAQKVERRVRKSEAALLLESHVGQQFDAIVTGRSVSDTWVRIFTPPVEGKLVARVPELEVGQRVRVKLVATNVERGFIDFVLVD